MYTKRTVCRRELFQLLKADNRQWKHLFHQSNFQFHLDFLTWSFMLLLTWLLYFVWWSLSVDCSLPMNSTLKNTVSAVVIKVLCTLMTCTSYWQGMFCGNQFPSWTNIFLTLQAFCLSNILFPAVWLTFSWSHLFTSAGGIWLWVVFVTMVAVNLSDNGGRSAVT